MNLVQKACFFTAFPDGRFFATAPTRDQARRIYWDDLKRLVPKALMACKPSESTLTIFLINGASICVTGMDVPERIEGSPVDGIILDEYANMKPGVWQEHVRPALSTPGRPGWAWFIGVPEGRNHFYRLCKDAKNREDWNVYHWYSADILSEKDIKDAMRDMDPLLFNQEFKGDFITFQGLAYHQWNEAVHASEMLNYNPRLPLIFCFDFNISPGVCAVIQEQEYTGNRLDVSNEIIAVIGEAYIPKHSRSDKICNKLIEDWGHHQEDIYCYGDSTGGSKGTAKRDGSDWEIINSMLRQGFTGKIRMRVPKGNPLERPRLNSLNARLRSADGMVNMLVDPVNAPHVVEDFESTTLLEGSAGEIDKDSDKMSSHMTDGIGYYTAKKYPIKTGGKIYRASFYDRGAKY